jgi:hypothetical protein
MCVYSTVDADQGFAMAGVMEKLTEKESNAHVVIKGDQSVGEEKGGGVCHSTLSPS